MAGKVEHFDVEAEKNSSHTAPNITPSNGAMAREARVFDHLDKYDVHKYTNSEQSHVRASAEHPRP